MMSEQDQPSSEDAILGHIPSGERDSRLGGPARPGASHRKRNRTAPTPPPDPEARPALPRGGLVVMRKSGGLKFSSREVVVYRDGRVVHRRHAPGVTIYTGAPQRLADDEIAELSRLIEQAAFPRFVTGAGRQPPDAFAYEIVARAGRRLKETEVFQGGIPESLASLIRRLDALMP